MLRIPRVLSALCVSPLAFTAPMQAQTLEPVDADALRQKPITRVDGSVG